MIVLFMAAVLFSLPFIPTLLEILHPSDDKPTPISRFQLQDVRNTQQDFFSVLELLLQNEKWMTLDAPDLHPLRNSAVRGFYALQDLRVHPGAHPVTIAVEKTMHCQNGAQIYEAHAKEKIVLEHGSEIMWWATAPIVEIHTHMHQRGKIEARDHLFVIGSCGFSSLKSKTLEIGNFPAQEMPQSVKVTAERHVFTKKWQNSEKILSGDYVVENHARLAAGTVLRGGLKAEGDLVIEKDCVIEGHVFVGGNLRSEGNTKISGVVIVEKNLYLGPGHEIGRTDATVTVSGDLIQISGPQLIHGTLRCWEHGEITS